MNLIAMNHYNNSFFVSYRVNNGDYLTSKKGAISAFF